MTTYIMYGGKGGVGKTTVAAATARHIADTGTETLVVSTDPAHSLGDVFDRDIDPTPTAIDDDGGGLYALEVDPTHRFAAEYADTVDDVLAEVRRLGVGVDRDALPDVDGGTVIRSSELAVVDLLARYQDRDDWKYVVFDTAPTGHTLQLLRLPSILDSAVGTVLDLKSRVDTVGRTLSGLVARERDGTADAGFDRGDIDDLRSVLDRAGSALRSRTRFRPIMEPEQLSLLETTRLIDRLEDNEIGTDVVIANKVLTDIDRDCDLCSRRHERQRTILAKARHRFEVPVVTIPLLADPNGSDALHAVAESLAAADR